MKLYTDNYKIKNIDCEIAYSWETKFIGRKIIRSEYDLLFDHNGYYPHIPRYEESDIILNLSPVVDKEDYISEIQWYKAKLLSFGHFKPHNEERDLNKSDIKLFERILNSVTEDHIEAEFKDLCDKLRSKRIIGNSGYKTLSIDKRSITFSDNSSNTITFENEYIKRGMELSHIYLEVLYDADALKTIPEVFKKEDIPLLLDIYALIDINGYRNIERLKNEAHERALCRKAEQGLSFLITAVKNNDINAVKQYAEYARFEDDYSKEYPLFEAIGNKNFEIVKILLDNGAETHDAVSLQYAVENNQHEVIKLLAEHNAVNNGIPGTISKTLCARQDLDTICLLLSHVTDPIGYYAFDPVELPFSMDIAKSLSKYDTAWINWPVNYIDAAYKTNKQLCIKMLSQGATKEVIDYLIGKQDFELTDLCLNRHSYVEPRKSFATVLTWDPKWYEMLKRHTAPAFNYSAMNNFLNRELGILIENEEFDRYISVVENLECGITYDSLMNGFVNCQNITDRKCLNHFVEYAIEHMGEEPEYIPGGSSYGDVGFKYFSEAVFRFCEEKLCEQFLDSYHIRFIKDFNYLVTVLKIALFDRDDAFYKYCIRFRINNAGEDCSLDMFNLFVKLIKLIQNDFKVHSYDDKEKIDEKNWKAQRCKQALIYLIELYSAESIEKGMLQDKYGHGDSNTLREYAIACGVQDKELLSYF